jgi:hypothetical protein
MVRVTAVEVKVAMSHVDVVCVSVLAVGAVGVVELVELVEVVRVQGLVVSWQAGRPFGRGHQASGQWTSRPREPALFSSQEPL